MANQNIGKVSLIDLPLNGGIQSDSSFPLTAKQEVENLFNAGQAYPVQTEPYLNYTINGQCILAFPTFEHSMNTYTPVSVVNSTTCILPLAYIRSFASHSPLDLGLFYTAGVNESGLTAYRYKGMSPLHTILSGTIVIQRRIALSLTAHRFRSTLYLNGGSLPNIELGQSEGRQYLGVSSASLSQIPQQLIPAEYSGELTDGINNPIDGYWVEEIISVNQDIVLYPNAVYSLRIASDAFGDGYESIQSHSIRLVSGGLSFIFDATSLVRSKFSKFIQG